MGWPLLEAQMVRKSACPLGSERTRRALELRQVATGAKQGDCPMASTFETVASIISSASDVPLEQIRPDSHVMKDLDIDSLAFLDITFEIDKSFGIQLPVDDWMSEVNEGKRSGDDYFILKNLCTQIDNLRAEVVA
jgi:acyl carrier protein